MPRGQPFTLLCQNLARQPHFGRADLHVHTTFSDGLYRPEEIIDLARRCGLGAVAITDHDTLAGVEPTRQAAQGTTIEVISGVEITTEYQGRELHLLGYFVDPNHPELAQALAWVRQQRAERFARMVEGLRAAGVRISWEPEKDRLGPESLGRRYLAELLVREGRVGSVREAFSRYLGDNGRFGFAKRRLPVADALNLIRNAGGVSSWAHPGSRCSWAQLGELSRLGLQAIEVAYPSVKASWQRQLRHWAGQLGLAVTGGSDCHGPGKNTLGSCGVTADELEAIKKRTQNQPQTFAS